MKSIYYTYMLAERPEQMLQHHCGLMPPLPNQPSGCRSQRRCDRLPWIDGPRSCSSGFALADQEQQLYCFFRILKEKLYDHHNKDQKQVSHRINYENLTKSKKLYICSMKISVKTSMIDDDLCLFLNQKRQEHNGRILYQSGPRGGGMSIAVKPLMHWVAPPSLTFRIY
jgi:hypothetical protein